MRDGTLQADVQSSMRGRSMTKPLVQAIMFATNGGLPQGNISVSIIADGRGSGRGIKQELFRHQKKHIPEDQNNLLGVKTNFS